MTPWILAAALVLLAYPASAQIKPTGQFVPGHTTRCMNPSCTVAGDAGGANGSSVPGSGYLTELGITNKGMSFSINSDVINSPTGYKQLSFGFDINGDGIISFNSFGGAAIGTLKCVINGQTSPCLVSGGSGDVNGPNAAAVLQVPSFNDSSGKLIGVSSTIAAPAYQVPPGPFLWQGAFPNSQLGLVRGSSGTPDETLGASIAVQKIGSAAIPSENPAGWFGIVATNMTLHAHGTALIGSATDNLPYPAFGNFMEGVRGDCYLITGSTNGQCNGMVAEAGTSAGTDYSFLIGIEATAENNSGIPASYNFSAGRFAATFLASCGVHGIVTSQQNCENAFMVNPNSASAVFLRGFFIPPLGHTLDPVGGKAIEIDATTGTGVQLHAGSFQFPITLPNGNGLWWSNAANNALYRGVYLNNANNLVLYDDLGGTGTVLLGRLGAGFALVLNQIVIPNMVTSCAGQTFGTIWNDAGTLKICP